MRFTGEWQRGKGWYCQPWDNSDRKDYEKRLREKQRKHLEEVEKNFREKMPWRPCLHNECSECHGTGVKKNGQPCIHMISCPCPRCSPYYL